MTKPRSSAELLASAENRDATLTSCLSARCPCCARLVENLPQLWRIEPCPLCRRPLTLVSMAGSRGCYRLRNVIDLAGSAYGIVTMLLVVTFVVSDMGPRTFAKGVTILLFIIGSLLLVDGALSLKTAIDRTFQITRFGLAAHVLGAGKALAGGLAAALLVIGLHL